MSLAPSRRSFLMMLLAVFANTYAARGDFTSSDSAVLASISVSVNDTRDLNTMTLQEVRRLFNTGGLVSDVDLIRLYTTNILRTLTERRYNQEPSLLGALLGWSYRDLPYGHLDVYTNGLLGVAYSINDRAKGILQEGANITGALYARDYSKSIYELVAEGFQTMSNQNAEIVQHMVFTNLFNTVSAPVDLTMLTNIAIIVANSFSPGGSLDGILRTLMPDYVWDDNFEEIRWTASLQPVWTAVISQRWPINAWGGGFIDHLSRLRPSFGSSLEWLTDLEGELVPSDIALEAMDYTGLANRYFFEYFNTAETFNYLTNELSQAQFSNTFSSVFSHLPELFTFSNSGEISINSNVVNNVGSGIAQVADDLAPRFYDEKPEMPITNDIGQVEDSNYQRFLEGVTSDSEIDTSFSEAVRSANSSIAGSMDNWRGSGSLVVTVPGISVLGATTDDVSLDMTLSDDTKQKINYYWGCLIKFLKVVMSLMFAIKSFMAIFGQASERDGMLFDI